MKKKLLIILVLCFSIVLVGCNNKDTKKDNKKENNTTQKATKKDNSLVGKWEYEEGYFTYTFNEDKTGTYDASGNLLMCH